MYIAPGQWQTTHWGQNLKSIEKPYHFAHLLQVFNTITLKSDSILFFFTDLIHVYSPRTGADNPLETNSGVNRKALSLYPFVASFK